MKVLKPHRPICELKKKNYLIVTKNKQNLFSTLLFFIYNLNYIMASNEYTTFRLYKEKIKIFILITLVNQYLMRRLSDPRKNKQRVITNNNNKFNA